MKAQEMLEEALSLVEPERGQDRRGVLLRLAMAHEGQGEVGKARANLDEVLLIDKKLGIPDEEDQEHRRRLNGPNGPPQAAVAAPS